MPAAEIGSVRPGDDTEGNEHHPGIVTAAVKLTPQQLEAAAAGAHLLRPTTFAAAAAPEMLSSALSVGDMAAARKP